LIFNEVADRPCRYGESRRFDTMPSSPSGSADEADVAGLGQPLDYLDALARSPQEPRQRELAPLERLGPEVHPVELEQVEAEQLHLPIVARGMQPIEVANPSVAQDHALAVQYEGTRA
jgi:hypothetical protein